MWWWHCSPHCRFDIEDDQSPLHIFLGDSLLSDSRRYPVSGSLEISLQAWTSPESNSAIPPLLLEMGGHEKIIVGLNTLEEKRIFFKLCEVCTL